MLIIFLTYKQKHTFLSYIHSQRNKEQDVFCIPYIAMVKSCTFYLQHAYKENNIIFTTNETKFPRN